MNFIVSDLLAYIMLPLILFIFLYLTSKYKKQRSFINVLLRYFSYVSFIILFWILSIKVSNYTSNASSDFYISSIKFLYDVLFYQMYTFFWIIMFYTLIYDEFEVNSFMKNVNEKVGKYKYLIQLFELFIINIILVILPLIIVIFTFNTNKSYNSIIDIIIFLEMFLFSFIFVIFRRNSRYHKNSVIVTFRSFSITIISWIYIVTFIINNWIYKESCAAILFLLVHALYFTIIYYKIGGTTIYVGYINYYKDDFFIKINKYRNKKEMFRSILIYLLWLVLFLFLLYNYY